MTSRRAGMVGRAIITTGKPSTRAALSLASAPLPPAFLQTRVLNSMLPHQRLVPCRGEGAARNHQAVVRQRWRRLRYVHDPKQVAVLRLPREGCKLQTPQRQHDTPWRSRQRRHRRRDIRHLQPTISRLRAPRRARQGNQRHLGPPASLDGVATDLRREGVGCVDQMRYALVAQIPRQARDATETANALGYRLRFGPRDTARVGQGRRQPARRHRLGQSTGFGGPAENKQVANYG